MSNAAGNGAAIITTRKHKFTLPPAGSNIEVRKFNPRSGKEFILTTLNTRPGNSNEESAALVLSERLDGHALALTQVTALIHSKKWSISKLLHMYEKYPLKVHDAENPGWSHAGNTYKVNTVFLISFKELSALAKAMLGVLSHLAPDTIPEALFAALEHPVPKPL